MALRVKPRSTFIGSASTSTLLSPLKFLIRPSVFFVGLVGRSYSAICSLVDTETVKVNLCLRPKLTERSLRHFVDVLAAGVVVAEVEHMRRLAALFHLYVDLV